MQLPAQSILVAKNNETKQQLERKRRRRGRKDKVHWYFRASKTRNSINVGPISAFPLKRWEIRLRDFKVGAVS